jgi:hypothetical protein
MRLYAAKYRQENNIEEKEVEDRNEEPSRSHMQEKSEQIVVLQTYRGGREEMKKAILLLVALALLAPMAFANGGAEKAKPMKIAFFVSDLSNGFHQGQFAEAKRYAKEKYGAEVYVFDGKSDGAVMTANVDQIVAQGMDAATLHIWDAEAARPGVQAALKKGIIMTSFFSPLGDMGIFTRVLGG